MKHINLFMSLGLLLVLPARPSAGEVAQAQLCNGSVRIHTGSCSCGFGLIFHLSFSSIYTEETSQANGELAPLPQPASFTHWSYLILEDPSMVTSVTIAELDVPTDKDLNGNGVADFFETSQAVATTTLGTYQSGWGPGILQAVWSRNAGSGQGTCDLTLNDPILGEMGPFHHSFEVMQYSGTLEYTPGSSTVSGIINVTLNGNPNSQMNGAVEFEKSPTNRFNFLMLQPGSWLRSNDVPQTFDESLITRDLSRPNQYRGTLQPSTGPFGTWTLLIQDPNDWNQNQIPDLSDDPQAAPVPRHPLLSLTCAGTNLQLVISGDLNHTHLVQEASSLTAPDWLTVQTITLTNDPQTFSLPRPGNQAKFWRVAAQ